MSSFRSPRRCSTPRTAGACMRDLRAARCLPLVSASTVLHALPPATRYVLRGGAEVRAAAESAVGCGIPARACRATLEGDRAALWLGPDEWLLIEIGRASCTVRV